MKIIQERETITKVYYHHMFNHDGDDTGAGLLLFDCDENGRPFFSTWNCVTGRWEFNSTSAERYYQAVAGEVDGKKVIDHGIQPYTRSWKEPKIGKCECGETVELENFTNTCSQCYADYDSSGNRLAPRSQWGEESGEHLSDILRIK